MTRAESSSDGVYGGLDEGSSEDLLMCKGSQIFVLKSPMHIVCFVLNCLLPGWGTMVSAFSCVHAHKNPDDCCCSCGTFTDGMFQFYLSPLIFGWIWSIIVGWNIYKKGRDFKVMM